MQIMIYDFHNYMNRPTLWYIYDIIVCILYISYAQWTVTMLGHNSHTFRSKPDHLEHFTGISTVGIEILKFMSITGDIGVMNAIFYCIRNKSDQPKWKKKHQLQEQTITQNEFKMTISKYTIIGSKW